MSSKTKSSKKLKTDSDLQSPDDNMSNQGITISMLNDDCLERIFFHLSLRDRIKCQRVCKSWQNISKSSCHSIHYLGLGCIFLGEKYTAKSKKAILSILTQVFSLCGKNLKYINLSSLTDLDYLKLIKKSCPKLESFYIPDCDATILKFLIENFPNLNSISLMHCLQNCDKLLSEYFSKNKKLTSFCIEHNDHLTGSFLPFLPESVDYIIVRYCTELFPENLGNAVQKLTNLKYLTLCGNLKFIEKINTILDRLPIDSTIENLNINCCTTMPTKKIMDVLNLKSLTNLKELTLEGSMLIYDETLFVIEKHCKKLTNLSLKDCKHVSDWGLETFMRSTNLETLFISHASIQDVSYMSKLKNLTCHCCHALEKYTIEYLIKNSKTLETLSVFMCEEISGKYLINMAVKAHTREEFLKVYYLDFHDVIETKIAASRLYVIKDTTKSLAKYFDENFLHSKI